MPETMKSPTQMILTRNNSFVIDSEDGGDVGDIGDYNSRDGYLN